MEMLIIGTGCALGYLMGDNRKLPIDNVKVSDADKPSGPNIYESNRSKIVDAEIRNLAAPKYKEKLNVMYPFDSNSRQENIQPDTFGDNFATVNFSTSTPQQTSTNNPVNPAVDNSPMFKNNDNSLQYQNPLVYNDPNSNVSLLTGQKYDPTHNNMNPFFTTSNTRISDSNSQVMLERFTGVPSTDNQGTYNVINEAVPGIVNPGEYVRRQDISNLDDRYSRAVAAIGIDNNNYQSSTVAISETPYKGDTRFLPKNINDLRSQSNQKYSYQGVITGGQKGSTRGMISQTRPLPFSNFVENATSDFVGNRSITTVAEMQAVPNVRCNTSTTSYSNNYTGPSNGSSKYNYTNDKMAYSTVLNNTVNRKIDPYQPHQYATGNINKNPAIGGFTIKQQKKEYSTPKGQAYYPSGTSNRQILPLKTTLRDTMVDKTTGAINPSTFIKDTNYRFDVENMHLDVTGKELLIDNKYIGQGHKDLGMGIRQNKFVDFVTSKETLVHDNSKRGAIKSLIERNMSYDAVFETGNDTCLPTKRVGAAGKKGTSKQTKVGQVFDDYSAPTTENYFSVPIYTQSTGAVVDRETFKETLEQYPGRVEFGDHYNGPQLGDAGISHDQAYRIKDHTSVQGRFNPGTGHDNPNDSLDINVNLKQDLDESDMRDMQSNTQPLGDKRLEPQVKVKDQPIYIDRLESSVRISNDLYPWLKKKSKTF